MTQSELDYARIERAIQFVLAAQECQPTLAEIARHVHLSPFHFDRLFHRWAGVSPKKFLQFITAQRAKGLLRSSASVLDAAHGSGLSGPGRLHDLFVSCEAVTPGEFKRRGAGLEIRWGEADSPFGRCWVALTDRGICALRFGVDDGEASLRAEWPEAATRRDPRGAERIVREVFAPEPHRAEPLRVFLRGTRFQLAVWKALLTVPSGATTTYHAIAKAIGKPTACRAVGNAVGANPIAWLIPCHRVLRENGALGGYRWGPSRKAVMLCREALYPQ